MTPSREIKERVDSSATNSLLVVVRGGEVYAAIFRSVAHVNPIRGGGAGA
jgi:hypothetical protein